jgi:hypothetical protein
VKVNLKLDPRQLFYWVLGIVGVVLLLWFLLWFNPARTRVTQLRNSIIPSAQSQIAAGQRAQNALPELRLTVEQREQERATYFERLPPIESHVESEWKQRLLAMEDQYGIKMIGGVKSRQSLADLKDRSLPKLPSWTYDLSISGPFANVYSAIRGLEDIGLDEQYSSIGSFSLAPQDTRSASPNVRTNFSFTIYYYQEEENAT